MTPTALTTLPGDAGSATVAAVLAELAAIGAQPFDQWDRMRSERVQELTGWLQCAAMWHSRGLDGAPGPAEGSSRSVVHGLITSHASLLARQRAEIAPFVGPDGALLGNDYDLHDKAADRHVEECVQMLGTVMAVLAGEFGRPAVSASEPDPQDGMDAVLDAMTDPDLEGGDIVEAIKDRLYSLGFDLSTAEEFDDA